MGRDITDARHCPPCVVLIHAPRVGRDESVPRNAGAGKRFNPRAPCGARRHLGFRPFEGEEFQSTRPVWGATRLHSVRGVGVKFQSTRPVWGATFSSLVDPRWTAFQSTRPVWGATCLLPNLESARTGFNPRAPCGARRTGWWIDDDRDRFQSTRPVWGATFRRLRVVLGNSVSIHAPRVGRDETVSV